jgi:copper chaperone
VERQKSHGYSGLRPDEQALREGMMAEAIMKIEGMSCQHCVMRVRKAVDQLPGVSRSDVKVGTALVEYDESRIKATDLEQAVEQAGYRVIKG